MQNNTKTSSITHEIIEDCEKCDNSLVFELSNGSDHYGVSVEAILTCLKLAENNNAVPKLGDDWWLTINRIYPEVGRTLGEYL